MSKANEERKREEQRRDSSDIRTTILFADLLKLARKRNRSEKDFQRIDQIEHLFETAIQD